MRLAVRIVGGGLDEDAVGADDGGVAAKVVGDVVVGDEVGVEIAAGEADHLQGVGRGIAGTAAQDVPVTAVRAHERAARASRSHPGGSGCYSCLIRCREMIAECVPATFAFCVTH